MDTAETLNILRPVLRPEILDPMLTEVRLKCIAVLDDTLNTFYPIPEDADQESSHASNFDPKKSKPMPSWMQKWAAKKTPQETETASKPNDGAQCSEQENPIMPVVKVKRRLMRRSSNFDKATKNTYPAQ